MNTIASRPATYVYGVALAEPFETGYPPLGVPGIGGPGAPVRTIALEELVAVVSDVPGLRIDLKRENLLGHQRVLEEVLRRSDVLPFSFGTVATNDEEVREVLLREGYDALREQLDYVRGCIELEVKVFWERERLFAEVAEENDEVRELRDALFLNPDDADSVDKIALGQLTEQEIERKSTWEADRVLAALDPIAVEGLVSANLSDTMLLNAAFLVERAREAEFDRTIATLAAERAGRMTFNYVGPLPPYSFINLAFDGEG